MSYKVDFSNVYCNDNLIKNTYENLDGEYKIHYTNGNLYLKYNLKNKVLHGLYEIYWGLNNNLYIKHIYNNGKLELHEKYYSNGQLKLKRPLLSQNENEFKTHGTLFKYYDNGNLKEMSEWANGDRNGITRIYYHHGDLDECSLWKNGVMNGYCEYNYPDGKLEKRENYINGELISSYNY